MLANWSINPRMFFLPLHILPNPNLTLGMIQCQEVTELLLGDPQTPYWLGVEHALGEKQNSQVLQTLRSEGRIPTKNLPVMLEVVRMRTLGYFLM